MNSTPDNTVLVAIFIMVEKIIDMRLIGFEPNFFSKALIS